ncbi:unnamed protein product [Ilex paraguariensis]|uniref:Uncharacterized protein n=1 Tax=Ilex paraguariensis TaxID=185542 RepID=A0ABC8RNN5_9AQUA
MEDYTGTATKFPTTSAPPPPPPPNGEPVTVFPVNSPNHNHINYFQAPPQNQPSTPAEWSTGLYDSYSNCSNCELKVSDDLYYGRCLSCCCPCITFGQIAEIVDKGSPPCVVSGALYALLQTLTCCGACLYSAIYRSKMRKQYMLPESPCGDCLVHCCCEPCALDQEYRELQNRGFDMSLGWKGNMEKQNRGVEMAPAVQGGMTR